MREIFLKYAKTGAMTRDDLARALKRSPTWVMVNSRRGQLIPRMPGKPIRFDPLAMIDVFCQSKPRTQTRKLKARGKSHGRRLS